MADVVVGTHYIVKSPGILAGEPRLAGRRISVSFIVELYVRQNTGVEEIARRFDLSLAEIHAALSYYYDHQAEIDAILEELDRAEAEHSNPQKQAEMRNRARKQARAHILISDREMTASEIAQYYGVAAATVREAATKGWVPARKSGATWLIRWADAESRWGEKPQ